MILEEKIIQARELLTGLEETVWLSLYDLHSEGSHRLKTIDISQCLGFSESSEVEIVKSVLRKLEARGHVENIGDTGDTWVIPSNLKLRVFPHER